MGARLIVGDARKVLAELPENSVDLVMSSPPFLALRSYLPADHPDKGKEIGSEATPADFLDTLLDVVEECRRVLTPTGSLVFELGDTYSGSGGAGGDYGDGGLRDGQGKFDGSNTRRGRVVDHDSGRRIPGIGWPLDKSLTGIPTLFAWSLAYGRNLLRPERLTDQWRIRNVVAWARPNPPVGALGDKFRPATSYLTVATTARDRWFDMDAVRTAPSERTAEQTTANDKGGVRGPAQSPQNPAGAPLLDWWEIPTQGFKGSHYATFPEELPRRVILSMCPERVCVECGEPSRRITETTNAVGRAVQRASHRLDPNGSGDGRTGVASVNTAPDHAQRVTLGWTDCGHNDWRPGVTLDPFAGSGTTGQVATRLGRDAILVELDERNVALMQARIGLFFERSEVS